MSTPALRYTLQLRDGLRWHTVKTYQPGDEDFRVLERVVFMLAGQTKKPARLLLMPFNVLAVTSL